MFNWFANGKDHTGNGYMMIVNASYDPGKFYERKIDGLCAGSTFIFPRGLPIYCRRINMAALHSTRLCASSSGVP